MDDQEFLRMMVAEPWDVYRCADRKEKLDLLRHRFSMYIPHADRVYEDLHIDLDDRAELKYPVNKAAVIGDDHSIKGFARFMFALGEGETKTFIWVTADGKREWILSRDGAVLYVDIPGFGEGFFIRYLDFRDECFAAYEKCYGWGYNADIRRIEVPATDYDFLKTLDVQDEFELVRFLDDGQSFETTDADRLLRYIDEQRRKEKASEEPDEDIMLIRYGDCWVPASKAESPNRNAIELGWDRVEYWPDSFAIMIRSEDDEDEYYSCGVRRVCFEPGLEVIKADILADNPDLTSVTIPASVKEVRTWAFGCCTNLKNLVIEGDISRVANWAKDAFEGCACEEEYLRLRNADR